MTASIVDLSINLSKEVSVKELNNLFKHYAENSLKGILEYTEEQLDPVRVKNCFNKKNPDQLNK